MKKSLLIGIIIAVVAIASVIFFVTRDDGTPATSGTNAARPVANTAAAELQSVSELLASGKSVKCTFALDDPNGDQSWTMYADGKKVRGDFSVAQTGVNAAPWDGHMLQDQEYVYTWGQSGGQAFATKMKIAAAANASANVNVNASAPAEAFDVDQKFEMDCDSWSADASKFVPPSDVTFTDLSAQLEQLQNLTNTAVTNAASQCAACDMAPDETAKAQCRSALGCS